MKSEYYEEPVHRPLPCLLVGLSEEDYVQMRIAVKNAKAYVTKISLGNDGLTDGDRRRITQAKRLWYDWRTVARMRYESDTNLAKEILKAEMERIYRNEKFMDK